MRVSPSPDAPLTLGGAPDDFGRILAAYGGVFVVGSLVWAMVADGYRPERFDIGGALVCLAGMAVIM
jgi:small multidrug resistance family-3 protein